MKQPLVQAWPPIRNVAYNRKMLKLRRRLWHGRSRGAVLRRYVAIWSTLELAAWLQLLADRETAQRRAAQQLLAAAWW